MEKYSEELINFIYTKTKFVNDKIFEQIKIKDSLTKEKSIILILEKYIDNQISNSPTKCIILYLTDLIKNDPLRKELLDTINEKSTKNNIKAQDIPETKFVLIYNITEDKFISENIDKLKEYFEDYLSQLKESMEYEEIKKKFIEGIALEEIEEQEMRKKVILPKINSCEITNVSENDVIINLPLFEENEILEKNKNIIKDNLKKYQKIKIEYILYLYNDDKKNYEKYIFPKEKGNINEITRKYEIKISNLKSDKLYMFLLGIKFGKHYSIPNFNKFYFMTLSQKKTGQLFVYGNKKYKNNLVDEKGKIILPNNNKSLTYNDCFQDNNTLFPLLYNSEIKDMSLSDTRLCYIQKDFLVIESGSIILIEPDDFFEGSFPKENSQIYISNNNNYLLKYFDSNPFLINFDKKIKIKKIRVGTEHCLALSNLGECYSWGKNTFGQLGLGKETNIIVGNPAKIKFDIYDINGNKYITNLKPFFYDIATGNIFSLALGIFNNKQMLYFWGNGSGILNDDNTKIIQSTFPKQINILENIKNIYAKFNSIGITCFDKEKKLNTLYIHGTQKFGIDVGIEKLNKANPIIVNYFKEINLDVIKVNFSITCMSVIGKNMDNGKIEIYLRGELTKKLFEFEEYKSRFYKLENNWSENIVDISPQERSLFILLKGGVVKKLFKNGKVLEEKDIKIEGYDLNNFDLENINNVEFQSFCEDNFVIFYRHKEN